MPKEDIARLLESAAHLLTAASHLVLVDSAGDRVASIIKQARELTAMTELAGDGVLGG